MEAPARYVLTLAAIAGAFVAGSWYAGWRSETQAGAESGAVLPGGDSVPTAHAAHAAAGVADSSLPAGHVHGAMAPAQGGPAFSAVGVVSVSPEQQQLMGVRVSPVEHGEARYTLRLFGRVAPDEALIYRVNAGIEGFVRDVSPVTTGGQVRKGQTLATFSAPDSRTAIQAYQTTLDVLERARRGAGDAPVQLNAANASVQLAVDRLMNLGISLDQIEEIARTRNLVPTNFRIVAPADGFVLMRNVSRGQKFSRGDEWYRIADLRRVWILANAFEGDAQYLRPGTHAQVSLPDQRGAVPATVSAVLPQFDASTRTLKVRLEANNPGFALRPEMPVDVVLSVSAAVSIAVPADAVLDSGLKKTVFVERGAGLFESRQVETGRRLGDRIEILEGLDPQDRVVVSGTFLLDSESRMRPSGGVAASGGHDHAAHDDGGPG